MDTDKHELKKNDTNLFDRIVAILEQARSNVVKSVNSNTVVAYWLIGREIVEEIQKGEQRAGYGERVIEDLSSKLTKRYRRGFSVPNLRNFRQFYMMFQDRKPEIHYPSGSELGDSGKKEIEESQSLKGFNPNLSWSHYRALMRVDKKEFRLMRTMTSARFEMLIKRLQCAL